MTDTRLTATLFAKAGCGACRKVDVQQLATRYKLGVVDVATPKGMADAMYYGLAGTWPTLILHSSGRWRAHVGLDAIRKLLQE